MSFAVSQWPYSPDPRLPDFAIIGFDFGQVPPWRWLMTTTGALAPFEILNTGNVWEPFSFGVDRVRYEPVIPMPGVGNANISFFGTQDPTGGGAGITQTMAIEFGFTFPNHELGFIQLLYPKAIQANGPFNMMNESSPSTNIPNPVTITPVRFDFALP